jgi:hypothetical protein
MGPPTRVAMPCSWRLKQKSPGPADIVATFPSRRRDYTEVGPNPLVKGR